MKTSEKIFQVFKWAAFGLVGAWVLLIIIRIPHNVEAQKTAEQVAKIHATKLTLDDVMGENLPPDPGVNANKTIAGVDANKNGIRDDVELAVFKAYPNSAKTRAVLLQYALALQMEFTQTVINKEIVTEIVREEDRGNMCIADALVPRATPSSSRNSLDLNKISKYINFILTIQVNSEQRKEYEKNFLKLLGSYSNSDNKKCDIDLTLL
jgi:hypothetical protein